MINSLTRYIASSWWRTIIGPCHIFCVLVFGLIGCAPDTVTVNTHPTFSPGSITTIGVVPFTALKGSPGVYQSLGELASPNVGSSEIRPSFGESAGPVPHRSHAKKVSVPTGAEEKVTDMVYANLRLRPGLQTISPGEIKQTLSRMAIRPSNTSNQQLAQKLGKALSLDAVVVGQVRVYRERDGQKYGAIPAAVGFDLQIINAKNGVVIWMGDYFEEQKSFTEDFKGMLDRGGKWVTAETLARSGVKRVMERLPLGRP